MNQEERLLYLTHTIRKQIKILSFSLVFHFKSFSQIIKIGWVFFFKERTRQKSSEKQDNLLTIDACKLIIFPSTDGWSLHPSRTKGVTLYSKQLLWTCWISTSRLRTSETKFSVSAYRYTLDCSRYMKKWYQWAFPPLHNPSIKFPWAPQRAQTAHLVSHIIVSFLGSLAPSRSGLTPAT